MEIKKWDFFKTIYLWSMIIRNVVAYLFMDFPDPDPDSDSDSEFADGQDLADRC